jgi:hypothetical protein
MPECVGNKPCSHPFAPVQCRVAWEASETLTARRVELVSSLVTTVLGLIRGLDRGSVEDGPTQRMESSSGISTIPPAKRRRARPGSSKLIFWRHNPCFLALSALVPVLFCAVVYAFMSSSAQGTSIAILMLSMLSHINPRYNCEPSVARCTRYKYKRCQTSPFVVYVILIDLLIELVLHDH